MARSMNKGYKSMLPTIGKDSFELLDMDRFFNEPLLNLPFFDRDFSVKVPATNIMENDDEIVVEVAAPGLNKKDFIVDTDGKMLEIKVEKEEESKEEKDSYTRKEYDYRAFYRSFKLPEFVKADKIKAEYVAGVLKVHLPKTKEASKKILTEISVS